MTIVLTFKKQGLAPNLMKLTKIRGVHEPVKLKLRVNLWLDSISSCVGVYHPLVTDNPQVFDRYLPSISWMGSIRLVMASNLQLHTENPKHSTKHNIKIHHCYCHTHLTIPKLPKAYYYTHTTKKLQKWLSNSKKKMRRGGGEQEKVTVICKRKGWVVFYFKEKFGKGTHTCMRNEFGF